MKVHYGDDLDFGFSHAKKDAEWKRSCEASAHIAVDNGVHFRVEGKSGNGFLHR